MRQLRSLVFLCSVTLLIGTTRAQGPEGLFGYDGTVADLYSVNASPPSSLFIGNDSNAGIASEIEFHNNVIYASDTGTNTNLHFINPVNGQVFNTLTMNFPAGGDVITAMEFVGNTLYAGFTTEGGGPSLLTTINITTGDVTTVGATGISSPLGGLAWDRSTRTLYAVSGGGTGELFTISLGTGLATSVGQINIGGTPVGTTGLEFGRGGVLYAIPNGGEAIFGNLLQVDKSTGNAIDLGPTGAGLNAITSIPEPSSVALLGLITLAGCACRRRIPG